MQPQSTGTYAHQALQTHFSHIRQQETSVLAHGDPEFLHQMQVGLRQAMAGMAERREEVVKRVRSPRRRVRWRRGVRRLGKNLILLLTILLLHREGIKGRSSGHRIRKKREIRSMDVCVVRVRLATTACPHRRKGRFSNWHHKHDCCSE